VEIICDYPSDFSKHGRLANARAPEQQDAPSSPHEVIDNSNRSVHGATHATSKANYTSPPVTDAGDAMKRTLNSGPIVLTNLAKPRDHVLDVGVANFSCAQLLFPF
jgi:hypothetical protein